MADPPNWNCGECEKPVIVRKGKTKGWFWYVCPCGASVRVKPGTDTGKSMAEVAK